MNLNQVTVPCGDLDASVAFYRRLGLRLIVNDPPNYARFECPVGDATFSLHRVPNAPDAHGIVVYFELEELDATVEQLRAAGLEFESGPRDQPWLWREACLRDPAGNRICLFHAGENRHDPPWRLPVKTAGAIHHIDITVTDLDRSTAFYERVLPRIGFRRSTNVPEGPIWAGAQLEVGLVAARSSAVHDRYSPGLHHLAFAAPSRAAVEALHQQLVELGDEVLDPPADYPQYARGYYAVFFADPDGIKLEYAFTPRWPG